MNKINYGKRYGNIMLGSLISEEEFPEKFSKDLKTMLLAQKHMEKGYTIIEFRIPKENQGYINFDTLYISTAFLIFQYGYAVDNYKVKHISVIKRTPKTITVAAKIVKNQKVYVPVAKKSIAC